MTRRKDASIVCGTKPESPIRSVRVIDSHTAGEPTRVVVAGGPPLGTGTVREQRERFRELHDDFRAAVVNEPRGSEAMVGALLCAPADPACSAGVVFFNNAGVIGMCGHGSIGIAVTLAHMGRIDRGLHRLETAVGNVTIELHDRHRVSVGNVLSYRYAREVPLDVARYGRVRGDVAWGGNWFFIVRSPGIAMHPGSLDELIAFTTGVRAALRSQGCTGPDGAEVDHVEVHAPLPAGEPRGSRNFVLCPGGAWDRSPCGTGTSAMLACLHADGVLAPGEPWRQESLIGTAFEATYAVEAHGRHVLPRITGSAYVTAEATLLLDDDDPLCWGLPPLSSRAR